ncbi:MAG: hypothetical protein ACK5E1_19170, partial [Bradyrhizobium sp.]|uniref:hypothetical protein n=1 Tax=Bradyrhizobium sp. TaxID=376 RepID=UPI00391D4264
MPVVVTVLAELADVVLDVLEVPEVALLTVMSTLPPQQESGRPQAGPNSPSNKPSTISRYSGLWFSAVSAET